MIPIGWRNPALLILGIGVSYLGNWIYLIALNVYIIDLTGSAAAVAGLYIIRPLAMLMTNLWSGSVIDRVNKRRLMIFIDIVRGLLVVCLPFLHSLWLIYFLLLLINLAGSFFGPSSQVYITKLIPESERKRVNALIGMAGNGAIMIGPAIAGVLMTTVSLAVCFYINAATFIICAFFIFLLPNVDEQNNHVRERIRLKTLIEDWRTIIRFSKGAKYFISVYLLFQTTMLICVALDSQEVTFLTRDLGLSNEAYGYIVAMTGIGAIFGGLCSSLLAKKLSLKLYIGAGMLLTSIGYIVFYASSHYLTATIAFVILGFFFTFANAGYVTFFQKQVPVDIMGRFASVADLLQGIVQIGLTLLLGLLAEWFTLQEVSVVFAVISGIVSIALVATIYRPSKASYFEDKAVSS